MAKQPILKDVGVKIMASLNVGFYGKEPVYTRELTPTELTDALNWYNYNMDFKEGVGFLAMYLNSQQDYDTAKMVRAGGADFFTFTLFKLARILLNGGKLPDYATGWFKDYLQEGKTKYLNAQLSKEATKSVSYKSKAPLNEFNVTVMNGIENAIDALDAKFDVKTYLKSVAISLETGSKIVAYYANEVANAKKLTVNLDTTQEQIDTYVAYLEKVLEGAKQFVGVSTDATGVAVVKVAKPRKPRAKKVIAPEKKVAKVKFMKEFPELGIKSIEPKTLVGATSVWLYDTKYGKLTNLRAKVVGGLDVKGTTLLGFDETNSKSKRIGRKAKDITKNLLAAGKVALRTFMNDIKTGETGFTGRINENMVIMRAEK